MTETYLADFRLVWRCVVAHLRNVFDNTWMLAGISPAVVVDAVRAAKLLDAVLNVRAPSCAMCCAGPMLLPSQQIAGW